MSFNSVFVGFLEGHRDAFLTLAISNTMDEMGMNLSPDFVSLCQHYLGNFPILS